MWCINLLALSTCTSNIIIYPFTSPVPPHNPLPPTLVFMIDEDIKDAQGFAANRTGGFGVVHFGDSNWLYKEQRAGLYTYQSRDSGWTFEALIPGSRPVVRSLQSVSVYKLCMYIEPMGLVSSCLQDIHRHKQQLYQNLCKKIPNQALLSDAFGRPSVTQKTFTSHLWSP